MGVYLGLNDVNVFGGQPTIEANLQTKSVIVSPTTARQSQIVVPDAGYDGLDEVDISVDPIPPEYIIPSGNKAITENGDDIDVTSFATVSVNVSGGIGELILEYPLGEISTTSTSATNTGKTLSLTNINPYEALIIIIAVDTPTRGRHLATVSYIFLNANTRVTTKTGGTIATAKQQYKYPPSGDVTSVTYTSAYGIYPYSIGIGSRGTATITIYQRYNSSYTTTIDGNYTARVYGVKLYELFGV